MQVRKLDIDGVLEITPPVFADDRGYFLESYNAEKLAQHGVDLVFVQDNQSLSKQKGVLRGLHFQTPPFAQDKLVRVLKGRIFDVAVDIRTGSPTFAQWVGLEISAEKQNQLLIPKGFAHGFVTLEENCEVAYKVSAPYSRECDRSVRFDDPAIAVNWPINSSDVILSEKDAIAPLLNQVDTGFKYK